MPGAFAAIVSAVVALPEIQGRCSEQMLRAAGVVAGLCLVVGFILIYESADSLRLVGRGSDRDDALGAAAESLWNGEHPYGRPTYLGNAISVLPGAIILALPLYALRLIPAASLLWLAVWIAAVCPQPRKSLLGLFWIALASPAALHDILTGGDLLANALYGHLAARSVLSTTGRREIWASGLFLAFSAASRWPMLVIWPIAVAGRWSSLKNREARASTPALIASGLVLIGLCLPIWTWPTDFSPLENWKKIGLSNPDAASSVVIVVCALLLTVASVLALRRTQTTAAAMTVLGLSVLLPLVVGATIMQIQQGISHIVPAWSYCLLAIPFFAAVVLESGAIPPTGQPRPPKT